MGDGSRLGDRCRDQATYVNKGYVGHNAPKPLRVYRSDQKRAVHAQIKKELRRRAAIEPVIGHLKSEGHLKRNYLKGRHDDQANAVLTATGHNLRLVTRWLRTLSAKILVAILGILRPNLAFNPAS
jgi:IS5 family transposase